MHNLKALKLVSNSKFQEYLEVVDPVAIISDPYLSSLPEFVINVCFSISILVTGSS